MRISRTRNRRFRNCIKTTEDIWVLMTRQRQTNLRSSSLPLKRLLSFLRTCKSLILLRANLVLRNRNPYRTRFLVWCLLRHLLSVHLLYHLKLLLNLIFMCLLFLLFLLHLMDVLFQFVMQILQNRFLKHLYCLLLTFLLFLLALHVVVYRDHPSHLLLLVICLLVNFPSLEMFVLKPLFSYNRG